MTATKLSESKIWSLMTEYYSHMGIDAWKDEIVPHDISTNKYLANIYAELIISALEDWLQTNQNCKDPIYIIEIGAGHGKFGFYILKLLEKKLAHKPEQLAKLKYLMTDISEKSLEEWQNHEALKEFSDKGLLDFALYNGFTDNKIDLILSKKTISPNSLNAPIISICNYLIDTLPHDAFQIINHKLNEQLIEVEEKNPSIASVEDNNKSTEDSKNNSTNDVDNKGEDDNNDDPSCKSQLLKYLKYKYLSKPISTNYYDCENINKILATYEKEFKDASILIPIGGITCIKSLESFTNKYVITLVADKGTLDEEEFEGLEDPEITFHGSVSLMVNFNALEHFYNNKGGLPLLLPNRYMDFQIGCLISNKNYQTTNLNAKYHELLEDFTPQDLFHLVYDKDDDVNPGISDLNTAIAILQLSKWDPGIFSSLSEKVIDFIEDDEDDKLFLQQEKTLLKGAEEVKNFFFKLESSQDMYFEIGTLLYALEHFEKAIELYNTSIRIFGMEAATMYNLALCYQALEEDNKAKEFCHKALAINPEYEDAIEMSKEFS